MTRDCFCNTQNNVTEDVIKRASGCERIYCSSISLNVPNFMVIYTGNKSVRYLKLPIEGILIERLRRRN